MFSIKLTEQDSSGNERCVVYVNVNKIYFMREDRDYTYIDLGDGMYMYVSDSVADIEQKIELKMERLENERREHFDQREGEASRTAVAEHARTVRTYTSWLDTFGNGD